MLTALTEPVHELIVRLVRNGNHIATAAAAAGLHERTVENWMRRGAESDEEPYHSFWRDVISAEATREDELVERIGRAGAAGPDYWQADAWLLSRRHPKRWQEKVQIEVNNELDRILTRLQERLSPQTYLEVLEAIADRSNAPPRPPSAVQTQDPGPRALPPRRAPAE